MLKDKDIEKKHIVNIGDGTKTGQLPSKLNYLSLEIEKLRFSLLILYPKPQFFFWLQSVLDFQGNGVQVKEVYFPEEDGVWLIPSSFHCHQDFQTFLECLKPIILERELAKWGPGELMPSVFSTKVFEEFFDFQIRDQAVNSLEFFERA